MTDTNELLWGQAIEDGNYHLAQEISELSEPNVDTTTDQSPKVDSAPKTQRAILGSAAYWGLDYGSLPNNEP